MLALVTGASRVAATDPSPESADRPDRRLLVAGGRDGARYEITVDGRLVPGQGATADAGRRISGSSTEGVVVDGARRYRFSGEVRDLAVRGDAGVYVGTEQVYPD